MVVLAVLGITAVFTSVRLADSPLPAGPADTSVSPLPADKQPVGSVEVLWTGEQSGRRVTLVSWFTHDFQLCTGNQVPGGYSGYGCWGSQPYDDGRAGFYGYSGTSRGASLDGDRVWFLATVGRGTARVTVTLVGGGQIEATLHHMDGPQAQLLAVAIAPHGSRAASLTAYNATGTQVDTMSVS